MHTRQWASPFLPVGGGRIDCFGSVSDALLWHIRSYCRILSTLLKCNVLDKKRDKETQEEEELYEQVRIYSKSAVLCVWRVGRRGVQCSVHHNVEM